MSNKRDYYEVLGLTKNASEQDIKSAFRKLSRKYHPDLQQGKTDKEKKEAEESFKECAEAYEVLSNKEKRANYDEFGFNTPGGNGFSGFNMNDFMRNHSGMFSSFFGGNPFGSMFGNDFRNSKSNTPDPNMPEDGNDMRIAINISFKESIFGVKKDFDINSFDPCPKCNGSGTKEGSTPKTCSECGGSGMKIQQQRTPFGLSITQSPCHRCHGSGYEIDECEHCHGKKRISAKKHVSINIPAGIDDGQKLRLKESGECGLKGGKNGDLYVVINVSESDVFIRRGQNLYISQPISPILASLGGKIDVFTPYGYTKIKIPEGIQSGKTLRIPGKGVKTQSGIGDLFVEIVIEPFVNLSTEQKDVLNNLQDLMIDNNYALQKELKNKINAF